MTKLDVWSDLGVKKERKPGFTLFASFVMATTREKSTEVRFFPHGNLGYAGSLLMQALSLSHRRVLCAISPGASLF